jgi:hypothetical protein
MATSEQAARDTADLEDLWPDPRGRGGVGGLVLGNRSIPGSAVSLSDRRRKNVPAPTSPRKLRLVRPASMAVIVGSCSRHPGTTATTASRSGSRPTAG